MHSHLQREDKPDVVTEEEEHHTIVLTFQKNLTWWMKFTAVW